MLPVTDGDAQLSRPVGPEDHAQGPADASLTLIEYGDFECPYSAEARHHILALQQRMGDKFRFVFRHFPLAKHRHALRAAEAAEAAEAQGRFWLMYHVLFEGKEERDRGGEHHARFGGQSELDDRQLESYAAELELDGDRFMGDLRQHRHLGRIQQDLESGQASGVTGTPTFFVNGRRHDGEYDADTLERVLLGE